MRIDTAEASTRYHNSLRACRTLIQTSKRNYEKQLTRVVKINKKKKNHHVHQNKNES